MKPLVVICSEDVEFYLILSHILEVDGFACALAGSAEEALRLVAETPPLAVILDCAPHGFPAPAVCTHLKQDAQTQAIPVVALIGAGAASQHIALLKAGLDESFTRPFTPAKLLHYLRSTMPAAPPAGDRRHGGRVLAFGTIEMRLDTYRVRCNDKEIHLGPTEFRLLRHLLENQGRVVSRDELINAAWPRNVYVSARTVDVHISRLRKSLKTVSKSDLIRTVRSAGYSLEDQNQ